jgi:uroporphyrinogen-III decarboxylase
MTLLTSQLNQQGASETDRLTGFDFARHNEEVRAMWAAYNAAKPYRIPIVLGTNMRFFMFNPDANPDALDFRTYTEDPDVMFDAQLRFARWCRFNLLQDSELGLPDKWIVSVNFQNFYEAAWFGCEIEYFGDQVPDTRPAFADAPEKVMERGLPDPFGGLMGRALEYDEYFKTRAAREEFLRRPIEAPVPWCGCGTDGPMTVACNLFGPEFVCMAMAAEPERIARLLAFITEATIGRMKAWRQRGGIPVPQDAFGFADDSIALISAEMYREHVLPHHRRLLAALASDTPRSIHLCGDATRHFRTIRDELNVQSFDTGFPVDFGRLREELGTQVRLQGGPHVELLRTATPHKVRQETTRILQTGILDGGFFVLREGNNLAPYTPLENTEAMYDVGRQLGRLNPADGGDA